MPTARHPLPITWTWAQFELCPGATFSALNRSTTSSAKPSSPKSSSSARLVRFSLPSSASARLSARAFSPAWGRLRPALHPDRAGLDTLALVRPWWFRSSSWPSPAASPRSATPNLPPWCPVSGSAYTYAYATLGELAAWIIGWDLILEYAVGNVAVAISWSDYFQSLLAGLQFQWPAWLGTDFRTAFQAFHKLDAAQGQGGDLTLWARRSCAVHRPGPTRHVSRAFRSSSTCPPCWS